MGGACPAPGPDDPLVRGLIGVVDCNVETLVRTGYSSLFEPSSPLAILLTSLLTIYIAVLGYGLLFGRSQLRVSDFALTAVKIGAVLALATQWSTYQSLVYETLFRGPQQLASAMLGGATGGQTSVGADVFNRLQRDFDLLSGFAGSYAKQPAPTQGASLIAGAPLIGGAGFGALTLTAAAGVLLLSSLGLLLAAKIVLGVLLAIGPVFIALMLFDSTRGLFEGWLRATLGAALVPLASTLLLAMLLTMLEPLLVQLSDLSAQGANSLAPVYSITILVLVFAAVSIGMVVASGIIAGGLRLPGRRMVAPPRDSASLAPTAPELSAQPRAVRIAAAASALDRRDARMTLSGVGAGESVGGASDRRTTISLASDRGRDPGPMFEPRLGQMGRRSSGPRTVRDPVRRPR